MKGIAMVKMSISYLGEKHCELQHPSNAKIETDAPKDNNGRGEAFSPTDLLAASLGSCMITTMAIQAEKLQIPFAKANAEVEKIMNLSPRKVARLKVHVVLDAILNHEQRQRLEKIARECPVALSLHPDLHVEISFTYL